MERVLMYDARGNEIEVLRKEGKWDSLSSLFYSVFLVAIAVTLLVMTVETAHRNYSRGPIAPIAAAPTLEACQAVFEAEWIPGRPAAPVAPQPIDAEDLPVDWWTNTTGDDPPSMVTDTIDLGFDTPNGWLELEEVSCAPHQIGAITCGFGTCTICTSEEK